MLFIPPMHYTLMSTSFGLNAALLSLLDSAPSEFGRLEVLSSPIVLMPTDRFAFEVLITTKHCSIKYTIDNSRILCYNTYHLAKKIGVDMPRHKRGWAIKDGQQRKRRRTPLTVALIEPALLLLINEKARHGYALVSALKDLGITPIHPSIVYRTLRQMESLGWITAEWDMDNKQGPPRKIFSLCDQGRAAYQTWQEELLKAQNSIDHMLERMS
ncbi:MAG: hypothetical protein GX142_00375 [Chloroflexi bacterium]|nr:hypothetical protein [Chloroflexota bacterium]